MMPDLPAVSSAIIKLADTAATAPGSNATSAVIMVLTAGGGGAIIAAIVAGLFSKKKLGAEATEIITKAAAGVVTDLRAELDRVTQARRDDAEKAAAERREHETEMRKIATAHAQERDAWKRVLQLHVAWDAIAIAKLGELDIKLPPAPPLSPAERFTDDQGYPL